MNIFYANPLQKILAEGKSQLKVIFSCITPKAFTFGVLIKPDYNHKNQRRMDVYMIPGLGADKRMYANQLKVLPQAKVLEHLEPVPHESLTAYAARIAKLIDTSKPFALVGTSLGGIVSMELSRIINPEKIVLIASVKNRAEMPIFIRSMRILNLHKLIPGTGFKRFNNLMVKRLDSRGDSPAAKVIKQMADDCSPKFIEWAINAIIHWHPPVNYRSDIVHIHGTNDMLFPIEKIRNPVAIKNGSHVMNMTMSYEVNKALLEALNEMPEPRS